MLAIIIPAYKATYFELTLQSLAEQTDNRFTVYIGDDASPENLEAIVKKFEGKIDIHYTRFKKNIGAEKLIWQWQRCIELSDNEEWIWLFSDDDIAAPNCVEAFYKCREEHPDFDVYRFNVTVVDGEGKIMHKTIEGPLIESSESMAYHLLRNLRGNSMPDHIFSRAIYQKTGGLVFTEYAQSADWAVSIKFSKERGMCIITGANIFWRYSGNNISAKAKNLKSKTIKGYLRFITWVSVHFQYLKEGNKEISYEKMMYALDRNCIQVFIKHYQYIPFRMIPLVQITFMKHLKKTFLKSLKLIYRINSEQAKGGFISRWKTIFGL